MKNKLLPGILLFASIYSSPNIGASSENIFVGEIILSNSLEIISYDAINPGDSVEKFTNRDNTIFYTADIGIINPIKKYYLIEIDCINSIGKRVFKESTKEPLKFKTNIQNDVLARLVKQVELNPKSGAMVEGQFALLESGNDYFIRLYVDNKLIGLSKFHYEIKKQG